MRTDFILSAEIVAITLGIVAEAPLLNQILILSGIAILVTIGVYGLVGGDRQAGRHGLLAGGKT
ncbi:DUF808 family protein [Klebsiella pneumoniae subsp. pneumoniae]|nr:DUF808 family protein [Klebsiella pneumoniae subsp. pneumoniae]